MGPKGKMKFVYFSAFGAVSVLLVSVYFFSTPSGMGSQEIELEPNNKNLIMVGYGVYLKNCASCHGIKLEGQKNWRSRDAAGYLPAPPHDETGHTWHHSDRYLFNMTKYGIEKIIGKTYPNNMPAYERLLSDNEIIAVLSYIKSTWPKNIRKRHDQINARARVNSNRS